MERILIQSISETHKVPIVIFLWLPILDDYHKIQWKYLFILQVGHLSSQWNRYSFLPNFQQSEDTSCYMRKNIQWSRQIDNMPRHVPCHATGFHHTPSPWTKVANKIIIFLFQFSDILWVYLSTTKLIIS